ncbi:DHA2 family efflux MFS transporter permease subunit [Ornithinimicrobium sp. LYQ121]|uniref:DHA2 family efflux MFS transporter permease subunit n=1 Tax=Ornithinimicrobium sp. LYQ121 TaxID=3378801 RepID=UPI0038532274
MAAPAPALPTNPWPALWALVIGFFMILVDSTIVSVATPALMGAFGVGVTEVLWVTSAYLLAYAVPLLITGRLGDRVGPRRVYLVGLSVFTLSSLWCGLSGELGTGISGLIAGRVVQGLGAAMMTPQTMAVITRTFPAERRGQAMALWGATAGVATLVGPLLGGVLVDTLGWEWIFFVNVPVGIVGLVLAARLVPRLETHVHRFDVLGVALSAVGLFCAVFAIQEGQTYDWGQIWGPVGVRGLLVTGVLLLVAFVWWQARNPAEPLVPLSLFADRNFSLANTAITTMAFTVTAMIFPFYLWAQSVRGLSPSTAALLMAPSSVVSFLLAPLAGHLTDRVHPRLLVGTGTTLLAASIWMLSSAMTPDAPLWRTVVAATLMGVANPLVWGPLSTTATRNLPLARAGAGAGVYNTTRQIGAVLGSATIAVLMEARIAARVGGGGGWAGAVGTPEGMPSAGATVPPAVAEELSQALAESLSLPVVVILVGAVASLFFERPRHMVRR